MKRGTPHSPSTLFAALSNLNKRTDHHLHSVFLVVEAAYAADIVSVDNCSERRLSMNGTSLHEPCLILDVSTYEEARRLGESCFLANANGTNT